MPKQYTGGLEKAHCGRAGSEAEAQAGLAGGYLDLDDLPAVETNEAAFLLAANHAVDFFGGEQLAVLAVAEAAFRAVELPEGLVDHAMHLLNELQQLQVRIGARVAQVAAQPISMSSF
jgi:hypothetical protein